MHDSAAVHVSLRWRPVLLAILVIDGLFLVLHGVSQWLALHGEDRFGRTFGGVELFDVDAEVSVPTWWQQLVIVIAAGLAASLGHIVARQDRDAGRPWKALALVLLVVSIDEGSEIHERLIEPMRDEFGITDGPLFLAWLIPGIGALAVFCLVFFRFWLRLADRPRRLMAIAGVLYVAGAFGMEMVGGSYQSARTAFDLWYVSIVGVEEGLEMAGMAVLVASLLETCRSVLPAGSVRVNVAA